jgi:hypothetical protein
VRLFDQGALLIALHNLKLTDHVYDIKSWNSNPTKRQLFHFDHTPISRTEIINQIKETNFNAVIVHYAGLPKMSQLCETNSPVIHNIIKRRCLTSLKIIMLGINSDLARSTATQFMNHTIDDSPYQLLYDDISTVDAATTAINRIDSTLTILTGENIWDVYRHCHKIDGLIIPIKSPIDEIQSVMNLRHISVSQATTYAENLLRNAYDHCRISRTPFIILWADLMQEYGQIIRQACAGHNLNLINDDKSIRRLNKAKPVPCKSNLSTQERIYVLNWFTLLMRDLQMIIPSPIVGII